MIRLTMREERLSTLFLVTGVVTIGCLVLEGNLKLAWVGTTALLSLAYYFSNYCLQLAELVGGEDSPLTQIQAIRTCLREAQEQLAPIDEAARRFSQMPMHIFEQHRRTRIILDALENRLDQIDALEEKRFVRNRSEKLLELLTEPLVVNKDLSLNAIISDSDIVPLPPELWLKAVKIHVNDLRKNMRRFILFSLWSRTR